MTKEDVTPAKETEKYVKNIKTIEGIGAAQEGANVYRKADGQKMMVTGVACSFIDKYGNRKEDIMRFTELGAEARLTND